MRLYYMLNLNAKNFSTKLVYVLHLNHLNSTTHDLYATTVVSNNNRVDLGRVNSVLKIRPKTGLGSNSFEALLCWEGG